MVNVAVQTAKKIGSRGSRHSETYRPYAIILQAEYFQKRLYTALLSA